MSADYTVVPAIEPTPAEIERVIRARVATLPRGNTYTDCVWVGSGLLIPARDLLASLGVDVSGDPPTRDPFAVRDRQRFQRVQPETEDDE